MKFLESTPWETVFARWEAREANNPSWIKCAIEEKGWNSWQEWRQFTASQLHLETRVWETVVLSDPFREIPQFLLGPYSAWQSRVTSKHTASFVDLINIPEQRSFFSKHTGITSIINSLPFDTELIGLVREDTGQIVCIDGHHRATAIALTQQRGTEIDFSQARITIALAHLPIGDIHLLDETLTRGSQKQIS